ncbi:MAG TPA: SDR family NAD(P)-dependent oxidoreductase [Acidimicrobiales bacterium]
MRDLGGKTAVVTGGASGIGRAMAERFRDAGMRVAIADVEKTTLDATAAELGVLGVRCDVSDAGSVGAMRDEVLAAFGAVHLLCNNAGVGGGGAIVDTTLNDWRWVLGVNLWGVVHGLDAFLPGMVAQGEGHVVNTASMAGLVAWPGIGPYNASKFAVVAISETLRAELEGTGVGVSVLCPGFVRTNIFTSQRNRPAELRNDEPKVAARTANADIVDTVSREGIAPQQVAADVHDAVVGDRFWILTHPHMVDAYAERSAEILELRPQA